MLSLLLGHAALLDHQRSPVAPLDAADRFNWTNEHGGPIVDRSDPIGRFVAVRPPSAAPAGTASEMSITRAAVQPLRASFNYTYASGFLASGNDLTTLYVETLQAALDACTAHAECRGITYSGGPNGTIVNSTKVYLKKATGHSGGAPWSTWLKVAPAGPPAQTFKLEGLTIALRADTYTVQWLNVSRKAYPLANLSFTPALTPGSALPLVQHLGDLTMRLRPASSSGAYDFFSSAWGPFTAKATPLALRPHELAAHDITPLLDATAAMGGSSNYGGKSPVTVRRAYRPATSGGGVELAFELKNTGAAAVEVGGLGASMPAAVSQDVHMGGSHGWVEWIRVHVTDWLALDQQCVVATPADPASGIENSRPIFEFGGNGFEWTFHSKAWAREWELNRQWPFECMADTLNATGIWPHPRSPWPSWGDGGQTVRTNFTADTHWNPPSARVLAPGESAAFTIRLSACPGGPRTRDAALTASGVATLRGVPGYTITTDMANASLFVSPPSGIRVTAAKSSDGGILRAEPPEPPLASGSIRIPLSGLARGRARVVVSLSDGSSAVAHYLVVPPLPTQIQRVTTHWSEVAWLPRDYPDPFGRSASVMPWDREDRRHRLNDGRAYDVGLSDDAGAANNLGLASALAYSPFQSAVSRLDEYISSTLYGLKQDTAMPPYKSLQLPDPNNGVRMTMFYYNQTYFAWNYTEAVECGVVAGVP